MPLPLAALAVALLLSGTSLRAESRTCRVVYPERPHTAPRTAFLFDGSASHEVMLQGTNFSDVIKLPAGEIVITLTPGQVGDSESIPPEAPQITIPEGVGDLYLIITDDPENPAFPLKMHMVHAEDGNLEPGETLWINQTKHRIVVALEDDEASIEPNGSTVTRDPVPESGYYAARFSYQPGGDHGLFI